MVLLDRRMSCEEVARVPLLDDDTVRGWWKLYQEQGIEGLSTFNHQGSACELSAEQQEQLKAWIAETLPRSTGPRSTGEVDAWIEHQFGVIYEARSGLIKLLHRLGFEYRKPEAVSSKLDPEKQRAFLKARRDLFVELADDEAVLFTGAVHPTHEARAVGCWSPKDTKIAIDQTSGRQRLNLIERLWGLMHKHVTHNKHYSTYNEFCNASLYFLREGVLKKWDECTSAVLDNFRVITSE